MTENDAICAMKIIPFLGKPVRVYILIYINVRGEQNFVQHPFMSYSKTHSKFAQGQSVRLKAATPHPSIPSHGKSPL